MISLILKSPHTNIISSLPVAHEMQRSSASSQALNFCIFSIRRGAANLEPQLESLFPSRHEDRGKYSQLSNRRQAGSCADSGEGEH